MTARSIAHLASFHLRRKRMRASLPFELPSPRTSNERLRSAPDAAWLHAGLADDIAASGCPERQLPAGPMVAIADHVFAALFAHGDGSRTAQSVRRALSPVEFGINRGSSGQLRAEGATGNANR